MAYLNRQKINDNPDQVLEIESLEQKNKILQDHTIVCGDIYAHWCGPCRNIAPEYEEISRKFFIRGRTFFCKENVDLGITQVVGVPTFHIFLKGELIKEIKGPKMAELRLFLTQMVATQLRSVEPYVQLDEAQSAYLAYRAQNPDIFIDQKGIPKNLR